MKPLRVVVRVEPGSKGKEKDEHENEKKRRGRGGERGELRCTERSRGSLHESLVCKRTLRNCHYVLGR